MTMFLILCFFISINDFILCILLISYFFLLQWINVVQFIEVATMLRIELMEYLWNCFEITIESMTLNFCAEFNEVEILIVIVIFLAFAFEFNRSDVLELRAIFTFTASAAIYHFVVLDFCWDIDTIGLIIISEVAVALFEDFPHILVIAQFVLLGLEDV